MATGRVYAVAGAKGGVGKTTTSLNLGAALAAAGRSVAVVELDLAMANFVDFLSLDVDPETDTTVHDVLAGDAAVADAVYDAPGGFSVVPSGTTLDGFAKTAVDGVADVLLTLREQYEVVLLDTGAGLSHETLLPLALADETLLVSSPRVASVRDVEKTKQLADRVGGTVAGVVFVRSGTGNSPPVDRIADFLDVPMFGHVPEDDAVPASQDAGQPAVTHAPDSEAAVAYVAIAERLGRRDAVAADHGRLASNAVRVRQETARHRGGFVFPEGESAEEADDDGVAAAVADAVESAGTPAGSDAADRQLESEPADATMGDSEAADDPVSTESQSALGATVDETAHSETPAQPAEDAASAYSKDSEESDDSGTESRSGRLGESSASSDQNDPSGTEQTAESSGTLRRRVGAVLQSVRRSF